MTCILLLISMIVVFSTPIMGDTIPSTGQGAIPFTVDAAGFQDVDEHNYGELYLQFLCKNLTFTQQKDHHRAIYKVDASFFIHKNTPTDTDDKPAIEHTWEKQVVVAQTKDLQNQMVMETFNFKLAPGSYTVRVRLTDLASQAEGICHAPLTLPNFKLTTPSLSDIQIAHHITPQTTLHSLVKNGFKVVPNATRKILVASPKLNIYFELYGLSKNKKETGTFDLAYILRDTLGYPIKHFPSARYRKPGKTAIKTETLDLMDISPGHYILETIARDTDTKKTTKRQRAFTIVPATKPTLATDAESLKRYLNQIRYIATKSELETYHSLPPEDKTTFILSFWKKRDPTPTTPQNEFAAEHFKRIRYADEHFPARPGAVGSDTDKGRIHIKYGLPTDIERSPFSATGKDYEIWIYEHLNYDQVVFLDRLGDGIQEMVHATLPGERYNPNWREEQATGDQTDPTALPEAAFGSPSQETDP